MKLRVTRHQNTLILQLLADDEITAFETLEITQLTRLRDWEKAFPGLGERFMHEYESLYGWKPILKPAIKHLELNAKCAIYWRNYTGIRLVSEWDENLVKTGLVDDFVRRNRVGFYPEDDTRLRVHLEALLRNMGYMTFPLFMAIATWIHLVGALILDNQYSHVDGCRSVTALFRSGNFPLGFDKEGNLLVLVADPPNTK